MPNMRSTRRGWSRRAITTAFTLWSLLPAVHSAFVDFDNCLSENIQGSRLLQFVPLNITASFNSTGRSLLNVTVLGNVTGQVYDGTYPPPSDPSWNDPNSTFGKIVDVQDGASLATTLFSSYNILTYTPYSAAPAQFCLDTVNDACPLGPAFYANSTDILDLPGYTVAHDMGSSYAFSTITVTTRIQSGLENGQYLACVNAYITPNLGSSLEGLLTWLPAAILIVVGVATIAAAMFSPWSSMDIFHWSSNHGRDEDVLRLVTPGFGDCLQYLQFIVLTGSLSLQYPGFFQPVVSNIGWSTLLFNESLVTHGDGTTVVVDGMYQYRPNSNQGLDRISQLIGMTSPKDAWADMMVWLVVIVGCAIVLTQIGFLLQWIYRQVKDVQPEDLRSKNWYFSVGNIVRIVIGYFLLPLVALSFYQFVIASLGPIYAVALAAVVLVMIIIFTGWLAFILVNTRPKSFPFDHLQTLLLYGPLYNTYDDNHAKFALVPILVNFLRGIAIGAVQSSGVAQVVLLAISEILFLLAINISRPYRAATSMNGYHTVFSATRLLTILLLIAFVPALNASPGSRGWVGYVILLIHACVLVFGFFLNALQTLVEVVARLAGAGGSGGRDAARGGLVKVFGMRQLSRRMPRPDAHRVTSMGSNAQILASSPNKPEMTMARSHTRSMSASSNLLMDSSRTKHAGQAEASSNGNRTPDGMSTFSRLSRQVMPGAIVGLAKTDSRDPYYRPPRRNTNDFTTSAGRPSGSTLDRKDLTAVDQAIDDSGEGSSQVKNDREEFDDQGLEQSRTKTDYAVRESDFYYRVRGGPLSGSTGTRKMRTGPADPTGPVSSARGWFKGLLGGKTKEKGKGFEVVRSARAPPEPFSDRPATNEPMLEDSYHDNAEIPQSPAKSRKPNDAESMISEPDSYTSPIPRAPTRPPMLPALDTMSGIELPSRVNSEASRRYAKAIEDEEIPAVPEIPRKSSRRESSPAKPASIRAPPAAATLVESPRRSIDPDHVVSPSRLPFTSSASTRQNRHSAAVSEISNFMDEAVVDQGPVSPTRPESIGYVSQHRASDHIRYSPSEAHIPHQSFVEYGYQNNNNNDTSPYQQRQQQQFTEEDAPWTPAWNGSSALNTDGTRRFSRFRD